MTPNRVALITGGSRGIGLGIARCLAQTGFDLAINGRRDADAVRDTISELEALGVSVLYCPADIADVNSRVAMVEAICQRFGRLDVLVNNAGVAPLERADILDAGEESFDRLIGINLKGPYFLTQSVARWMIEQRQADSSFRGRIVTVGSMSAEVASVNRGDYCIAKAGLSMAARLWAVRLAEFGIDVFEVRPGVIATDMTATVQEKYDKMIAKGLTLEPRWGTPEDVGKAVAALARGDIPYATGQILNIDGGLTVPRM